MWSSSKLAMDETRRDDDGDKRHGASERSVEVEEEEELPTGVGMGNSQDPSWVVGLDWIGLDWGLGQVRGGGGGLVEDWWRKMADGDGTRRRSVVVVVVAVVVVGGLVRYFNLP